MYQKSDWIKAVSKLSRLTVQGDVKWEKLELDEDDLPDPNDRVGRAFSANIKDKQYRVFEVKRRTFTDEFNFYWNIYVYLDVYSSKRGVRDEFVARSPLLPVVADLWRTIERKYAHQNGALDDLLGDESVGEEEEEEEGLKPKW
ncbi:MAG: hypothetical protein QM576_15835 [Rhodopseudomonas sp.]|uniref:hypothetical protein n=1 Tax=Rhodopseudomonas sp. TaxID=1078 RepID=UPI0039E56CFA